MKSRVLSLILSSRFRVELADYDAPIGCTSSFSHLQAPSGQRLLSLNTSHANLASAILAISLSLRLASQQTRSWPKREQLLGSATGSASWLQRGLLKKTFFKLYGRDGDSVAMAMERKRIVHTLDTPYSAVGWSATLGISRSLCAVP